MLKLHLDNLTRHGIDAVRSGNTSAGRGLLEQAVKEEPNNVLAWHWLASIAPDAAERKRYLERVLEIDPKNTFALRDLAELNSHRGLPTHTPSITTSGWPAQPSPTPQRGSAAVPKSSAQAPRPWPGGSGTEAGASLAAMAGPNRPAVSVLDALEEQWSTAATGMDATPSPGATTDAWPWNGPAAVAGGQETGGPRALAGSQTSAIPTTPPTGMTTAIPTTSPTGRPAAMPATPPGGQQPSGSTIANAAGPANIRGATPASNATGVAADAAADAGLAASGLTHDQLLRADDVMAMVQRPRQSRASRRTRSGPPYVLVLVILMLLGMGLVVGMVARHVVTARTPSQVSRTASQPGRPAAQPNHVSSSENGTSAQNASAQANDASSKANDTSSQAQDTSPQANDTSAQANGVSAQANGSSTQANGASTQANGGSAQVDDASAQANGASSQAKGTVAQTNSRPAPVSDVLAAQPRTRTVHTSAGDFAIPSTAYLRNRPSTTGMDGSVVPVASEPFGPASSSTCTLPPGAAVLLLDSRAAEDGSQAFQVQNRECSGWVAETLLSKAPISIGDAAPGTQEIWQPGK